MLYIPKEIHRSGIQVNASTNVADDATAGEEVVVGTVGKGFQAAINFFLKGSPEAVRVVASRLNRGAGQGHATVQVFSINAQASAAEFSRVRECIVFTTVRSRGITSIVNGNDRLPVCKASVVLLKEFDGEDLAIQLIFDLGDERIVHPLTNLRNSNGTFGDSHFLKSLSG